jgi:probable F420-dependent oxidoreductase
MRIGIVSPVLVQLPGVASTWEADAGPEELVEIARAADRLGYQHLTCSEHVVVPREHAQLRGGTYWDPLAALSFLAAVTHRLRLLTHVLVLGYHHPLAIAKRYGTLDRLSHGRLVLGVGVGSLREEFELLGAPFEDRGARADDGMRALRASLSSSEPGYHGTHHAFEGFVVEPHAVQERVPLWVGGRTARSLRRAVELGDGWVPFGLRRSELAAMLQGAEPPPGFEVVLGAGRPLDPQADPDGARGGLERSREAGATIVNVTIAATSSKHYVEQLEALADLVDVEPPPDPAAQEAA